MTEKIFHIQLWTPKIQEVAQNLIDNIHAVVPETQVLFMGAAALKLPGKGDIDLDILCDQKDVASYTQKLSPILGSPKETRNALTAWEFKYQDFDIDVILSDPVISHVPEQQKVFEKLKTNPKLLNEYRQLKEACDGLPYVEYEKRKKDFFAEIILGQ
jgi:hypothetical protein